MTKYEFYKNDPVALAEKINQIKDTCAKYKFDLSEAIVKFLCGEHIDITGKVKRGSDTTVVVNVGFVFNLHDIGDPANQTDANVVKGFYEGVVDDLIRKGSYNFGYYSPDSITFGETQVFCFGGDPK